MLVILGIFIGLFIGIIFTFIICKNIFLKEKDYSELIKNTLYELNNYNNDDASKKTLKLGLKSY